MNERVFGRGTLAPPVDRWNRLVGGGASGGSPCGGGRLTSIGTSVLGRRAVDTSVPVRFRCPALISERRPAGLAASFGISGVPDTPDQAHETF